MANKDGVVSIGFDYKKELDEVCATIEKELNNLGGDINLSDGIKKQMAEIKKMITDMKKDIGSSFDKITETKLDTKTFETFKKDVNKRIREVNKEVSILKEQFSALDGSANVNGIVQQFANLKKHVEDSNASISEFISNSEKLGKSVVISSTLNTDELQNDVLEIKKLLTDINKEDLDFGYTNKSTKELTNDLEGLVDKYYRITDLIDEMKSSMNGIDATTQEYKNQEVQLSKLSLELLKCSAQMDDLFGAKNAEKINVDKIISVDELDDIFSHMQNISSKIKLEAKNIVESIELSNTAVKNVGNNTISDLSNKSNIELHISTKQSTINKQLDEMIDNLQQRAANKPIIAPVKLRVDSEYEKTTKNSTASALTENQINEARKDVESVVPGLEKAFNNSMRIATNKAVETAKESIKAVREFFESNPITVHLTIPDDEKAKIGKAILSEDGKTTVNISGEVDKARKSVKGLSEDLEKSQLLIKENAQNAKNLSLEKLVNSLSETMSQFSELKGIITSIQNMENTIARASGISSTNELVEQWSIVEKTIINATKLDGDFRKNANIGKIVSEYQKYIDMGGTNTLSGIDKIKDNESTINSILSKMKELKIQDVENDSIQKLSVDLDGVIAKFDELISTVKTATNALYKIIRDGNVSDLDKQWSSISNKFKSIADESGKINLSKQKTDIKELMDMYQKYTNAGGINSLMSLTDNVETLRKLDKEYQKLNQAQSVDNSSTIEKESKSFDKVEKSVDSLTTAIGDTKVQAINIEATAMEDAAEREIVAIRSILDNLDLIVSRLKDIKGIKLPKIEVKNVDVVEKAVESLANAGNKSNISSKNQIIESQSRIQEELKETELQAEKTEGKIINLFDKISKNDEIDTRSGYEKMADGLDGLDEEFKRSEEYASKLLDLVQEIARLNSKNIGFVEAEDADRIDEIIKQYPELQRYYMLKQKDFDIDEFMDYCETLEKAHLYFQWLNNDLAEFVDYDNKVNNSDGIQYFNRELSDLNEEIQRATGSSENFIEKYKGISDALTDGRLDYMSAFKSILEKEFPDYDVYNVVNGFQLLPKTKKDISDIGEEISKSESKVISFSEKLKEMANTSISKDVLSNNPIVESQNDIQEELKETQIEVEKTTSKYQGLLNAAQEKIKNDSTGYYSNDIEWEALSDFQWSESIKRVNFNEPFEENHLKLSDSIDKIQSDFKQSVISFDEAIDQLVEAYKKYDSATNTHVADFDFLNNKQTNLNETILDTATAYEKMTEAEKEARKDIFQGDDKSITDASTTAIKEESKALEQVSTSAKEASKSKEKFAKANKEVKASADSSKTSISEEEKYFNSLGKSIEKYDNTLTSISRKPADGNRSKELQDKIDIISASLVELKTLESNASKDGYVFNEEDVNRGKELEQTIKNNIELVKQMSAAQKGSTEAARWKEIDKISKYLEKNTRISKDAKRQLQEYIALLKTGSAKNIEEIHMAFNKLAEAERVAGREGKSFLDIFKNKVVYNYAAQLAGYYLSFMDIIRYAKQGVDAVKEFDDGLTKISYTMDMTKSKLNDLGSSVLNMASDMKSSVDDAMSVAQIYANMQTTAEEIQSLSEPTLILTNLSGFDSSTIADDIQAVNQQFDILAEDSMHIADVYDYISRNIAVDYSKGLNSMAEGLQVAGSTAKQAGLSFEQTASIIAKAVEKTRLEGSQVGNGLKTIMTRLSKVGELSDEVDNETLSQASESLKKVGIEVYNLDGSYREFDVIMGELANKWSDLTDAEKSNISFAIAATRQTNLLSAVLSNFSDSMQLAEEATNANGSALENQQKYMDSFAGHLQSLETEAKIAWINILDSETLKGGVDLLTGLVKVIGQLVDKFGLLGTAGLVGSGILAKNGIG